MPKNDEKQCFTFFAFLPPYWRGLAVDAATWIVDEVENGELRMKGEIEGGKRGEMRMMVMILMMMLIMMDVR